MDYCSRIRKNVTENREKRTKKIEQKKENRETNYRVPSNRRWNGGLSGPIVGLFEVIV